MYIYYAVHSPLRGYVHLLVIVPPRLHPTNHKRGRHDPRMVSITTRIITTRPSSAHFSSSFHHLQTAFLPPPPSLPAKSMLISSSPIVLILLDTRWRTPSPSMCASHSTSLSSSTIVPRSISILRSTRSRGRAITRLARLTGIHVATIRRCRTVSVVGRRRGSLTRIKRGRKRLGGGDGDVALLLWDR